MLYQTSKLESNYVIVFLFKKWEKKKASRYRRFSNASAKSVMRFSHSAVCRNHTMKPALCLHLNFMLLFNWRFWGIVKCFIGAKLWARSVIFYWNRTRPKFESQMNRNIWFQFFKPVLLDESFVINCALRSKLFFWKYSRERKMYVKCCELNVYWKQLLMH